MNPGSRRVACTVVNALLALYVAETGPLTKSPDLEIGGEPIALGGIAFGFEGQADMGGRIGWPDRLILGERFVWGERFIWGAQLM